MAVTPTNAPKILSILCIVGIVCTAMVLSVRILFRYRLKGPLGWDDAASAIGSVVAICQSILTLFAIRSGLGKRHVELSSDEIALIFKANYVANILYIVTLCFSTWSLGLLVSRLCLLTRHFRFCKILLTITSAWAIGSILAIGFQCALPRPWDIRRTCSNIPLRWTIVESIGFLMQLVPCIAISRMVWHLALPLATKVTVVATFSTQLFIIVPVALRIRFILSFSLRDPTYNLTNIGFATQVAMHLSIITASFPCLRQFLKTFRAKLKDTQQAVAERRILAVNRSSHLPHQMGRDDSGLDVERLGNNNSSQLGIVRQS